MRSLAANFYPGSNDGSKRMSPDENGWVWEPLTSSHIAAMAELKDEAAVLIRYNNGSIYKFPANAEEAQGLRNAVSPGRYTRLMFEGRGTRIS